MDTQHFSRIITEFNNRNAKLSQSGLNLSDGGTTALGAWFLGPKAENEDLLLRLVKRIIRGHCKARRSFYPEDPEWITNERKNSNGYLASVQFLTERLNEMILALEGSVPFYSYRYQGHMLWDTTLPSVLGYIAALLYNQNNVAAEASPVTTWLEMVVGDDLCRMLGYFIPERGEDGSHKDCPNEREEQTAAWGHITCDGSVANAEALWAARNLKYLPIGIAAALKSIDSLSPARGLRVVLGTEESKMLIELSTWELLNIPLSEVLGLEQRLKCNYTYGKHVDVDSLLAPFKLQNAGLVEMARLYANTAENPAVLCPATAHYSWPKGMSLLGLGRNSTVYIKVDSDARLDIQDLRRALDNCLHNRRPVIMAVAVLGTTEQSAVDPLSELLEERKRYRRLGLEFWIHVDAAWGGYFASMLRKPNEPLNDDTIPLSSEQMQERSSLQAKSAFDSRDEQEIFYGPHVVMSEYVFRQYECIRDSDSVTIDPHKAGYIPYPAGGLCYRDSRMRNLVAFTAPVVYHGGVDPTVGVYGIEGSKPGAAAAAVYLSHRVISTDESGYGRILGRSMWNSKRLYCALVTMANQEDRFVVKTFQRLPSERVRQPSQEAICTELDRIRREIVPLTNKELLAAFCNDHIMLEWFKSLGSDQIIVAYAFNFIRKCGKINDDMISMNKFNQELFRRLSLGSRENSIPNVPVFVTSSIYEPSVYGADFVDSFAKRLGIKASGTSINFLISTTMDPWISDTASGDFIPVITSEIKKIIQDILTQSKFD